MIGFIKRLFGPDRTAITDFIENGAIILDVRSAQEFQSGHAIDSQNIPLQKLYLEIDQLKKLGKPVVTCCASGVRSAAAAKQLKAAGINAINGGAWYKVYALE